MKLTYIIAPYTAPTHIQVKQNISDAEILAQYYWLSHNAVICPHLNTSFFSGLIPEEIFYHGTLLMLSKCDQAIVHPRYQQSTGSKKEIKFAYDNNIDLSFISFKEFQTIKNHLIKTINKG